MIHFRFILRLREKSSELLRPAGKTKLHSINNYAFTVPILVVLSLQEHKVYIVHKE